jgi:hypothetical protein
MRQGREWDANYNTMKIEMLISKKYLTGGKTNNIVGESGTSKSWKVEKDVNKFSAVMMMDWG